MKIVLFWLRRMLRLTWGVPVLAVLGSWLCMLGACGASVSSSGVAVEVRMILGWVGYAVWLVQWLLLLVLAVWLLVFTARRLMLRQWKALLAWLWSALAVVLVLPAIAMGFFASAFACYDDFTLGISVPQELAPGGEYGMAVPRRMHFQAPLHERRDAGLPPLVQQYADLCSVKYTTLVDADEALPASPPNLEKLAAETPELLHEYRLRACCHEALTPGFHAHRCLTNLYHPDYPAFYEYLLEGDEWEGLLANGWRYLGHKKASGEPSVFTLKEMKELDESLAPLASSPDLKTLDSLVPSLPDKPFIVLTQRGQPGMYRLLLVAPRDYPAGTFCVKAREYTRGRELATRNKQIQSLSTTPLYQICQLSEAVDFTVYSGEWGEYYASVWELHFTPADGSPSRCVNSQLYLMQGWSR